jgi:hypothetical protein
MTADDSEDKYPRETDTAPVKSRLQFHLITALVLMFVTGFILLANLHSYTTDAFMENGGRKTGTCQGQGWPFNFRPTIFGNSLVFDPNPFVVAANVFVAVIILIVIWQSLEFIIRWKCGGKLPPSP